MPRVYAPRCKSERCQLKWQNRIRLYIRSGKGWKAIGWFCPVCKGVQVSEHAET